MTLSRFLFTLTAVALVGGAATGAHAADEPLPQAYDPAEKINRVIFGFNQGVDQLLLRPVAKVYGLTPRPAREGIHNVLTNLHEPTVFFNDVLQLNGRRAGVTLGRFTINSTVGLFGLIDVASGHDLPYHGADFGQTLGRYGVPPGPVLELPILGSSSLRDTVGHLASSFMNPVSYASGGAVNEARLGLTVAGIADGASRILPLTDRLRAEGTDYYAAVRDLSAAHRAQSIEDAKADVVVGHAPPNPDLPLSSLVPD